MFRAIFPKSDYSKNVITLITGTAFAQAIPIAIAPILTRIYGPEEMGMFALYMSIVAVLSIIATGRYELAIMMPKKNSDAASIAVLAMTISVFVSLLLFGFVVLFKGSISVLLGRPEIEPFLFLVPLSVFVTGIYQSLNYWSNRQKHFRRIATSRVVQSTAMTSTHVFGGISGLGIFGLIAGGIIGQIVATVALAKMIWKEDKQLFNKVTKEDQILLAQRYIKYPKFLLIAHLLNSISSQSPIFLLSALFTSASAGFYMLTQRVISAPVSLIAQALGDVFRQEASHAFIHEGNCIKQYKQTFKKLVIIATVPFAIFAYFAPDFFEFIFGGEWRVSGVYAQILTPMFFLKFITSPLSTMFLIAGKQRLDLIWQTALTICTVSSFGVGYYLSDVGISLVAFSSSYTVLYTINGLMTWSFAKGKG